MKKSYFKPPVSTPFRIIKQCISQRCCFIPSDWLALCQNARSCLLAPVLLRSFWAAQGGHRSLRLFLSGSAAQATLKWLVSHCRPTAASCLLPHTVAGDKPVMLDLLRPVGFPCKTHFILLPISIWAHYCSAEHPLHAVVRPSPHLWFLSLLFLLSRWSGTVGSEAC